MDKIVSIVFIVLGILSFLLGTSFLSDISESALMSGSMGLVPSLVGAFGAYLKRASIGKSILFGILFSFLTAVLQVVFFVVIWPML